MLRSSVLSWTRPRLARAISRRGFHSTAFAMAPKVVATRVLPPNAQARLEKENFDLKQWKEDSSMPRETLLKEIQGTLVS